MATGVLKCIEKKNVGNTIRIPLQTVPKIANLTNRCHFIIQDLL